MFIKFFPDQVTFERFSFVRLNFILLFYILISVTYSIAMASETRVALIFGNSNYEQISLLKNAAKDAQDMSDKLSSLGFRVISGVNLTKRQMDKKIKEFDKIIRAGDVANTVALFYYAGHGLEVEGINYIVPIDAQMDVQNDAKYEGISLNRITKKIERTRSRLNIIILDACRNNPLPRGERVMGEVGWTDNIESSAMGTFIAFGTSAGKTAADSDGQGDNGLYTKHILKNIGLEGLTLEQVFKKVRDGVYKDSHHKQKTWQNNSTTGDFFFKPGKRQTLAVEIVVEKQPVWMIPLFVAVGLILLATLVMFFKQRQKIKWAESVVLSRELKKDDKVFKQEIIRSRLVKNDVVGYLKDLNQNKIIQLFKSSDRTIIGRTSPADIVINDDVISSKHCEIGYDASVKTFWIKDLDSSNGVWYGEDNQLSPNKKVKLKDGQVFYLANQNHPMVLVKNNN